MNLPNGVICFLSGCTAVVAVAQSAEPAPQPTAISRKVISEHAIDGTSKVLQLILVEVPPGAQSVPHTHPAVGLNYIISGEVDSQYEGEVVKRFKAGDSYQDPAGRKHLLFKNISTTEPLKFIIAVELEKGQVFMQPLP
jgi:quercetin dioxygenase-like cupin family protein